ncbi:hypothetical protein ACWGQT_00110 [Streptomyces yangpuensis]
MTAALERTVPKNQSTAAARARTAARAGEKYTTALRSQSSPAVYEPPSTFPGDGGPWISAWDGNPYNDVNPACGHHYKALCGGCGVCITCDGCYCREAAEEARIDAETERAYEEHAYHEKHTPECYLCERGRKESADYTRCPKCGITYPDGFEDHMAHVPPYCYALPAYPTGIDWGYLRGQHVTLVGRDYSVHGLIIADQPAPDPADYRPQMQLQRTDPGYEDDFGPVNLRGWLEVRPAPQA